MLQYFVEVVSREDESVVDTVGPCASERAANKVDNGMNINLNHDEYFTRIVQKESER